jgi:hypothetical protein
MALFGAVREVEPWTASSVAVGIILAVGLIGVLVWRLRRYLRP